MQIKKEGVSCKILAFCKVRESGARIFSQFCDINNPIRAVRAICSLHFIRLFPSSHILRSRNTKIMAIHHTERSRGSYSNESLVSGDRDSSETAKTRRITHQTRVSDAKERQTPKAEFAWFWQQISGAELSRCESDFQSLICINHPASLGRLQCARVRTHTYIQHSSFALSPFFPFISREFVGLFEYRAPRFSLFLSVRPAEHVLRALLQFYVTPGTFFSSNVLFALYSRRDCRYRGWYVWISAVCFFQVRVYVDWRRENERDREMNQVHRDSLWHCKRRGSIIRGCLMDLSTAGVTLSTNIAATMVQDSGTPR